MNPGPIHNVPNLAHGANSASKLGSSAISSEDGAKSSDFANMLTDLLSTTNSQMVNADLQSRQMLAGESKNIHEVMIALEKANISFRFLNQVRNKAVEAYQEVFRMQL